MTRRPSKKQPSRRRMQKERGVWVLRRTGKPLIADEARPRRRVMGAYRASHKRYSGLYKRLAEQTAPRMMEKTVRWNIKVSKQTDRAVRALLGARGGNRDGKSWTDGTFPSVAAAHNRQRAKAEPVLAVENKRLLCCFGGPLRRPASLLRNQAALRSFLEFLHAFG